MTINLSPRHVTSLPSLPFTRVFLPSLPLGRGDERPSERSCLSPPFFILPYGKHFSSENLRLRKRNARDPGKTKIPEAVSSSPRCSARAMTIAMTRAMTITPEISARGSLMLWA